MDSTNFNHGMTWASQWRFAVVPLFVFVHLCEAQVTLPDTPAALLDSLNAREAIEDYAALKAAQDRFSGSILIARRGKVLLERSFGLTDRATRVPVRADTRFRLGSMNKMFTAVATLQLVEAGKLRLDEPISTYLTDYPNQELAEKVTVYHLLTHTGGTGDIFGREYRENRLKLRTLNDYLSLYGERELEFQPGEHWRYSNYGFILLGALIEKVTGNSYYDHIRESVFRPAGMTRSDSLPEETEVAGRAIGYTRRSGKWIPNTDRLPWRGTSAGGGYSTTGDLYRFAEALTSGKLMKADLLKQATTRQEGNYGLGFRVFGGGYEPRGWGHGGGAAGMNGELRVYPDSGWVIVVLANLDPPIATYIADHFELRMSDVL